MNKGHGGVNKLPSVHQLVGQPPPHSSAAGPNLGPMGESQALGTQGGWGGPKGGPGSRHSCPAQTHTRDSRQLPPFSSSGLLAGGRATDGPLCPFLTAGRAACASDSVTRLLSGPGLLNNHGHTLAANGEMNSGHSSQSVVSGSHCTPPPPYHADPSLVRYVGCC